MVPQFFLGGTTRHVSSRLSFIVFYLYTLQPMNIPLFYLDIFGDVKRKSDNATGIVRHNAHYVAITGAYQ